MGNWKYHDIVLDIDQDCLDYGVPTRQGCPIALAALKAGIERPLVGVYGTFKGVIPGEGAFSETLPVNARYFIIHFDEKKKKLETIKIQMRVATANIAGNP